MGRRTTLALEPRRLDVKHEAPERVALIENGRLETTKGIFVVDEESAASIMAIYRAMTRKWLCWDYHHRTEKECNTEEEGIAAGWFGLKLDGLTVYADPIKWAPAGRTRIEALEYLFFSPVIVSEPIAGRKERRIIAILSCALTNTPSSLRQKPLVELERLFMDGVEKLLPAGAIYIGEFQDGVICYRMGEDLYTAKVGGTADAPALENAVQWTRGSTVALSADPVTRALQVRVVELERATLHRDVSSLLAGGVARGAILPAEVERLSALGVSGSLGFGEVKARADGPVLIKDNVAKKPDQGEAVTKEQFSKMSTRERAALSQSNPTLYLQMVKR